MSSESPQGFSELVGLTFTDIEPGYSRGEVEVTPELQNPDNVLHASVLHTMADTGMGAALYPELAEGDSCATIEINIRYFQPVRTGTVVCKTSLLQKGQSIAYLESELTNDEQTVAKASGSYSVFTP